MSHITVEIIFISILLLHCIATVDIIGFTHPHSFENFNNYNVLSRFKFEKFGEI